MNRSHTDDEELEKHADAVRRSAEAHMKKVPKSDRAKQSAKADAKAVEAHHELTNPKHNRALPS